MILNPTSVAVDTQGLIYVANTGSDTIEKLSLSGSTATRVGTVPFIPPSAYTRDPNAVVVIP